MANEIDQPHDKLVHTVLANYRGCKTCTERRRNEVEAPIVFRAVDHIEATEVAYDTEQRKGR